MGMLLKLFSIIVIILLSGCENVQEHISSNSVVRPMDYTKYLSEKPSRSLNLLFIHHSCGATLLADPGEKIGEYCLFPTHPNGGGLRNMLRQNNYNVHEATYGSQLGQDTDINHWHVKFKDQMDLVLRTKLQDDLLEEGVVNQIIVFKSCYPNNHFVGNGVPPGDPDSAERTVWNAKAAYKSLLPLFEKYPDVLFVAVTAPPIVKPWMNKYKEMLLDVVNMGPESVGVRARDFNNWLNDVDSGWLSGYDIKNVVVFDYYDLLTGYGKSNWAKYPTREGRDSHPSREGNSIAAEKFVVFINRAVRYAGLADNE